MRKKLVIIWLTILLLVVIKLFWHNEWVYRLPTPVPANYSFVASGARINLDAELKTDRAKPLFLHFFNPSCPCSRFNMPHVKSLVKEYGDKVNFAVVVLASKKYTEKEIQQRFGIDVPVLFDSTIAATCGVYSTPQAAIIDVHQNLYFRGNYNKSRYCTEKKTEYARMALEGLLSHQPNTITDKFALKAYGCQLPKCNKQ
jgi:hypothetical protein